MKHAGNEKAFNELKEKVRQIAEQHKIGFTVYLPSLEFANSGWVIVNVLTQSSFGEAGLTEVLKFAMQYNRLLGGWFDDETGQYYYDAVILEPDKDKAIALMKMHNQKAIFNLETKEYIANEAFDDETN